MASFRAGQVLNAAGQGLGLLFEREYQKETEAAKREWDLTLESMRQAREDARSDLEFQRNFALYHAEQANAERRHTQDLSARAAEGEADRKATLSVARMNRDARSVEFNREEVYKRESDLQNRLMDVEASRAKAKENVFDPEQAANIDAQYDEMRDQAIVGHTLALLDMERKKPGSAPGYGAASPQDLQHLLSRNGMDFEGAKLYGTEMWGAFTGQAPDQEPSRITPQYLNDATSKMPADMDPGRASWDPATQSWFEPQSQPQQSAAPAPLYPSKPQDQLFSERTNPSDPNFIPFRESGVGQFVDRWRRGMGTEAAQQQQQELLQRGMNERP